ncbi:MAG: CDP-diacylglycerol--glycerol-3-phosphate 3-phosphatidyltransferase [Planctomycetaceae bacterium]|jgi:CDP-diacylglycerol--glycerol-3-phosphate 3-phosphatidyltransferase|nr:CDP-diacylglycerol--glycerol-3-phosphate 3-phosphatidyltransferase [Planctomycetaceae bacterium]
MSAFHVVWNVPNSATVARLILAVLTFCLIPFGLYWASFALFVLAASTDWFDGWYARRYQQVTVLGRILDPFADKIIICGTFIFLVAEPALTTRWYGLQPWMAVVIVGRELLVTGLRSFIEQKGGDFSAKMSGKLKMVFQCVAGAAALAILAWGPEPPVLLNATFLVSLWLAVFYTIHSGVGYVSAAIRMVSLT